MVRILGSTGSRRRRHYQLAAIFSVAALLALIAVPASAVLTGSPSNFEANDGNMIVNGGAGFNDWASVSFTHVSDAAAVNSDNSFTPGQKQDTTCPTTTGHKNPPKDDFTDVASFSETNTTTKDTYLYGATIRVAANGNASENIELKQGTTLCPGEPLGGLTARTAGDKLIAIDYLNGGTNVQFNVLTWVVTGACFVGNDTAPCWGASVLTLSAAGAEGLASQAAITAANNPINGAALVAGQFAEFGVNLRVAGIIPAGTCKAFPQTVWESRSSGSSFVSSTKDISIENKTISNCGEVVIIKRTNPRGVDQDFGFTSTIPDPATPVTTDSSPYCQADTSPSAFTLNDKDGATGDSANNTEDCLNVQPGSYTVTEGANPTGFTFDSLSCTVVGSGGSTGGQDGTVPKQANITVAAGDTVTCVYVNKQQQGAIKITKTSSKGANPTLAGAKFSISFGGSPITGSPFTTDNAGEICVDHLAFGTYSVQETEAPTGYVIDDTGAHNVSVSANSTCGDGNEATFAATDSPKADIQVNFRDGGSGATSATISCDNTTGTTTTTPVPSGWQTSKTVTGIVVNPSPITVTCTIVIDP